MNKLLTSWFSTYFKWTLVYYHNKKGNILTKHPHHFVMLTKETSHQKLTTETHTSQSHQPITQPPTPFCLVDEENIPPKTNHRNSHHPITPPPTPYCHVDKGNITPENNSKNSNQPPTPFCHVDEGNITSETNHRNSHQPITPANHTTTHTILSC